MNEFFEALKSKRVRKEYIKSVLVGSFTTAVDYVLQAVIMFAAGSKHYKNFLSVFTGSTVSGEPYNLPLSIFLTSIVISFVVSVLLNYVLSMKFVYQYGNVGKSKKGFLKFAVFALIGLSVTTAVSLVGQAIFGRQGFTIWIIKIVTTFVVFFFNFFTRKYFVFNIALIKDDENTINL